MASITKVFRCFRKNLLVPLVSVLGLLYLVLLVLGEIDPEDRRLGYTEVALLALIILVNSDVTERLAKLRVGSEGVTVKLEEIEEKQGKINQVQNIQKQEIKNLAGLLVRDLLGTQERELLKKLASDQPLSYERKESFEKDLIRLCDLELVESSSNASLHVKDIPPASDDLKQFVSVSELGYICLRFMQKAFSDQLLDALELEEP